VEFEELRQIIRLLKEEGLSEITVWEGDNRITVRQEVGLVASSPVAGAVQPREVHPDEPGTFTVTAPLLGTFYSRPSPEEEPFVAEGDMVEKEQTLCIIEAMKVLNEIKAEEQGRLRQVLVKDGETVEYGQPLFLFEKG